MFTHQTSSTGPPKGNGSAEWAVQTAKNLFQKYKIWGQDLQLSLLVVRNTLRDNLGYYLMSAQQKDAHHNFHCRNNGTRSYNLYNRMSRSS